MKRNYKNNVQIPPYGKVRKSIRGKCIFVEGRNDEFVFKSIVNPSWKVKIYGESSSVRGKNCIVNDFKENYIPGQIAIIDKDYDIVEEISNVFYTDFNDIECMAINYMDINEIKKSLKIDPTISLEDFEIKILSIVKKLSCEFSNLWNYFRKEDMQEKYIFNSISFNFYLKDIIDNKNMNIKYDKLNDYYKNRVDTKKIIESMPNNNSFRGHDFFALLLYVVNLRKTKLNIIDANDLEGIFIRNSLEYEWIRKSELYKIIELDYKDIFKK